MDGFGSHTFQWVNAAGEAFWVKYHFKTDQGIKCLTTEEATRTAGADPDFHGRDLHAAIERGEYPSWTLKMQIMPLADAPKYRFNPVRPDQGMVAEGLSADRSRQARRSIAIRRITSPRSSRPRSTRRTSYPASVRRPTRCCKGGSSPTAIRIDTASARITRSFRSTARTRPKTSNYQRDGAMRFDGNAGRREELRAQQLRRSGAIEPADSGRRPRFMASPDSSNGSVIAMTTISFRPATCIG